MDVVCVWLVSPLGNKTVKFLQNEVVIVEYLSNTDVLDFSKKYEIIVLPLKVVGADGCPARVLVKEIEEYD